MLPPAQRRNASVRGGDWRDDTGALQEAVQLGRRSCDANRRGNEGLFQTGDREGRRAHVQHVSRTVPLTVKLNGRAEAPDERRVPKPMCSWETTLKGSATGKRYIHRRPEYLQSVTDGIEALYAALAVLVKKPFKGRELVDQPQPDCAIEASALANYLPSSETRFCNLLNLARETRLE